jgi:hypothetical protein
MHTSTQGWQVVDPHPILMSEYCFGPGMANALAVGVDGGLVVISPPVKPALGLFEELSQHGPVNALVASNAFHYMGIPAWKDRFPDAQIFAPAQSIARVEKQTRLSGIRPLADAAAISGSRLELIDMPHYKTGEVLVRIKTDRGLVWYVTDIVMNLQALPKQLVFRLMFQLSGTAPGLRFNNIAPLFMVKDKKALKRWLASEVDSAPPSRLIPSHGAIVEVGADVERVRRLFAAR